MRSKNEIKAVGRELAELHKRLSTGDMRGTMVAKSVENRLRAVLWVLGQDVSMVPSEEAIKFFWSLYE